MLPMITASTMQNLQPGTWTVTSLTPFSRMDATADHLS
jgi:hypothetical protein